MSVCGIKYLLILIWGVAVCSAFFSAQSSAGTEAYNVCVFSKDPTKYPPKCYQCPTVVYIRSLLACANATSMPSNITYDSANCLEQNCQINYPTAKPAPMLDKASLFEALGKIFRMQRSIVDESPGEAVAENEVPQTYWRIIKNVNTYASDYVNIDIDYET